MYKISLIGAGNIGGTLAHILGQEGFADIILFDIAEKLAKGKALDIEQSLADIGKSTRITGTNNYEDIRDSDVIIVTAGIARKPGMSRDDLVATNKKIISEIAENIKVYAPNAFVIVITNPLDVMVYVMMKASGLNPKKIVGMAGVLDSSRFRLFLAREFAVSMKDVSAFVLGGHGDTMVPVTSYSSIGGVPLTELIKKGEITEARLEEIVQRTRDGGAEIVALLQTGSAYYAPAQAAISMAKAYLFDEKRLLPCAAYLNGEYGVKDLYLGVPVIIGKHGIEKIIEVSLNAKETEMLHYSVDAVKKMIDNIETT